jgi:micrococcal nuclease
MSRRSKNAIILVCVLVAVVLVLIDRSFCPFKSAPSNDVVTRSPSDFAKYHKQSFRVTYVVDGDTIDIDVPDSDRSNTRLRLLGIDTPETKHPRMGKMHFGSQASEYTSKMTLNKKVTIYLDTVANQRDKYGRLLCYVYLEDGQVLNELLVSQGYAYADLRFKHSFYNKYKTLQNQAKKNQLGLWKNVTTDDLPAWLIERKPGILN